MGFAGRGAEEGIDPIVATFPCLAPLLNRRGGALSGGELLLAIARCLAGQPKLILFDEPKESIPPSIIEELVGILRQLHRSQGLTILPVEQNLEFIGRAGPARADHPEGRDPPRAAAGGSAARRRAERVRGRGGGWRGAVRPGHARGVSVQYTLRTPPTPLSGKTHGRDPRCGCSLAVPHHHDYLTSRARYRGEQARL